MSSFSNASEMQLPFPHGVEIELQVIRKDGTWIRGEDVLEIFDKIVSSAKGLLDKKIRTSSVETVRQKYEQSSQTEEGERGSRIVATYKDPAGNPKEYTLLGHDPNVVSLTWILEVATPPCTTLEELAWWIQTLIAITYESLPKDSQAILISTGLNPTQEYLRNLSFGEHHHILSEDVDETIKIAVYNMIRNFIPHLIALSVNSPFESKKPSDEISIDEDGIVRAPRCKRSIRLFRNTTQMGPTNEFEFIPHIRVADKDAFAKHVNRSYSRMVDCYPFTDYGTIELRVFDTQLSIPRRMGLALILQALALKAKRMIENGEAIPDVGAKSLSANRASAVAAGLWGPFRPGEGSDEYHTVYNHQVSDGGSVDTAKRNRFLGDAVISMLYLIRDELDELKVVENPFMQALLVSVFGSEYTNPRTTEADFQLDVYAKSDYNMVVLLKRLAEVTRECSTNWLYDPIEGTPHLPTWLCWWKGLEPEIVIDTDRTFAGQEAEFSILIRNSTGRNLDNLTVKYSVEDSLRNTIDNNLLAIDSIETGEIHVSRVAFPTRKDTSAYNIIMEVGFAGRQINLTNTINMYWMSASVRPGTTTQFADGKTPVLFNGEIETNYASDSLVNCQINILAPNLERIIVGTAEMLRVDAGEITTFDSSFFPSLIIPPDIAEGVERCVLQIRLMNEEGTEIAESTSKPFYVGFVKRGPQIIFESDLKSSYTPGELVVGHIVVSDRNNTIGPSARMMVDYYSESGKTTDIETFQYEEFMKGSATFQWRIPRADVMPQIERVGVIRVRVIERGNVITSIESDRFSIDQVTTRVNLDSMRVPQRSHIGGKISGWLRIRRNTEQGDPAFLTLSFVFPDDEEHVVLRQAVKQSKNLSLAFGPLTIPASKRSTSPKSVKLVAVLSYVGLEMDRRSTTIDLVGGPSADFARIDFIGLPSFTVPDQMLQVTIQVESGLRETIDCVLSVGLESIAGNSILFERNINLEPGKPKMIPVPFRVPLGAEMSTAHLKAVLMCGSQSCENSQRFKVKAIEKPFFNVGFSIRNEAGEEIPGLVARLTPVEIIVDIESAREDLQDLGINVRVISRRDIIKEFDIPLSNQKKNTVSMKWLTPPIDVVTGYFLDAEISQHGRPLPHRAVEMVKKQFTVY
ncbi:MAG: glutamate-cysteine ligase family protein [Candidatus Thorarchaeota archaeon]